MDFDEPPAVVQVQEEAGGEPSYVTEDGTLVIDILVPQPCGASTEQEIVVCAPDQGQHRLNAPEPIVEGEGFRPELQIAPNAKAVLRAETDGLTGAERVMIDIKIKF